MSAHCAVHWGLFLNPGRTYSSVSGWVTLYQYGTTDAFDTNAPPHGDSLTIWSGQTFLWDYAVGYSLDSNSIYRVSNCPAYGGVNASSALGCYWSCTSGAPTFSSVTFYPTPLFGSAMPFSRTITPTPSPLVLELRICLNENHVSEDIYIGDFSLTVL